MWIVQSTLHRHFSIVEADLVRAVARRVTDLRWNVTEVIQHKCDETRQSHTHC